MIIQTEFIVPNLLQYKKNNNQVKSVTLCLITNWKHYVIYKVLYFKSTGEEGDDEVTIVKENILRHVDLLEEELDGRWFVEILESRGDEACMKILTIIKRSQSRKCCTKPFVRFLCEEEDVGWFIEALYEYSPHLHAILTQSKNQAIECGTLRLFIKTYCFQNNVRKSF
jgi:hypothetical protein